MKELRAFLPPPGNPARPVQIVLLAFFWANLIGWNIAMPALGISSGGTAFVTILIAVIAVICCGFTWLYGESFEKQRATLSSGMVWAQWVLTPGEYELYARRTNSEYTTLAVSLALLGIALGVGSLIVSANLLLGGTFTGIFLFAALFVAWVGRVPIGPTPTATDPLIVRIGPGVAMVGDQIFPFRGAGLRLLSVELKHETGTLPSLVFLAKSGRGRHATYAETHIPVPADHIPDALAVVERLTTDETIADRSSFPWLASHTHAGRDYSADDIAPLMGHGTSAKRRTDSSARLGRWIR